MARKVRRLSGRFRRNTAQSRTSLAGPPESSMPEPSLAIRRFTILWAFMKRFTEYRFGASAVQ